MTLDLGLKAALLADDAKCSAERERSRARLGFALLVLLLGGCSDWWTNDWTPPVDLIITFPDAATDGQTMPGEASPYLRPVRQ